jgi:hypothetical protein
LRHDRDDRWRHEHHRQPEHSFRDHNTGDRPGWDHGKKRGWKGDNLPPGQAKKT